MNTGIERNVTTRFTGSDVARWRRQELPQECAECWRTDCDGRGRCDTLARVGPRALRMGIWLARQAFSMGQLYGL